MSRYKPQRMDAPRPTSDPPTDEKIIEYARAFYGVDFADALREALISHPWNFGAYLRLSFTREMEKKS